MNPCCICHEHLSGSPPITACCHQPIHTACFNQLGPCNMKPGSANCPLCRSQNLRKCPRIRSMSDFVRKLNKLTRAIRENEDKFFETSTVNPNWEKIPYELRSCFTSKESIRYFIAALTARCEHIKLLSSNKRVSFLVVGHLATDSLNHQIKEAIYDWKLLKERHYIREPYCTKEQLTYFETCNTFKDELDHA